MTSHSIFPFIQAHNCQQVLLLCYTFAAAVVPRMQSGLPKCLADMWAGVLIPSVQCSSHICPIAVRKIPTISRYHGQHGRFLFLFVSFFSLRSCLYYLLSTLSVIITNNKVVVSSTFQSLLITLERVDGFLPNVISTTVTRTRLEAIHPLYILKS